MNIHLRICLQISLFFSGSPTGPYIQHSFDQANSVLPNMILIFNTNLGTYTTLMNG